MYIWHRGIQEPGYFIKHFSWKKKINIYNVDQLKKSDIKKIFANEKKDYVDTYKIRLLRKYIKKNYDYSFTSIKKIKKLRKKLKIVLSEHEREDIYRLDELAFAQNRAIKKLDTPFDLSTNERCIFRLDEGILYTISDDGKLVRRFSGMTYVTDRRTVIVGADSTTESIEYWQYDRTKIKPYGIVFENSKNITAPKVLRSDDNDLMYIYFHRIFEIQS